MNDVTFAKAPWWAKALMTIPMFFYTLFRDFRTFVLFFGAASVATQGSVLVLAMLGGGLYAGAPAAWYVMTALVAAVFALLCKVIVLSNRVLRLDHDNRELRDALQRREVPFAENVTVDDVSRTPS